MNRDAIGAVGEVVGALAVVVSVIYLAAQVKGSAKESAAGRSAGILDEYNRMPEVMIASPELTHLFTKLRKNETLTDEEDTLLESVSNRFLTHWYSIQTAFDHKLIDRNVYEVFYEDVSRWINSYPPMHRKFREIMTNYSMSADVPIYAPILREREPF